MPRCSEHLPERRALPQQLDPAARRAGTASGRAVSMRPGGTVRDVDRNDSMRVRVAVDEVEDAVLAGIEPGDEGGPRHRAVRRRRRGQRREAAALAEARQIRQPALRRCRSRDQVVVEAVDAEHDHAAAGGDVARPPQAATSASAARSTPRRDASRRRPLMRRRPTAGRPCGGRRRGRTGAAPSARCRRSTDRRRRSTLRLQKSTPGTRRGSMQWSPLHALVLSSNTGPDTTPVAPSHDAR